MIPMAVMTLLFIVKMKKRFFIFLCSISFCTSLFSDVEYFERKNYLLSLIGEKTKIEKKDILRCLRLNENGNIAYFALTQTDEGIMFSYRLLSKKNNKYFHAFKMDRILDQEPTDYLLKIHRYISEDIELKVSTDPYFMNGFMEYNKSNEVILLNLDDPDLNDEFAILYNFLYQLSNLSDKRDLRAEYWPYEAYKKNYLEMALDLSGERFENVSLLDSLVKVQDLVDTFGYPNRVSTSLNRIHWGYFLKNRGMIVIALDHELNIIPNSARILYKEPAYHGDFPLIEQEKRMGERKSLEENGSGRNGTNLRGF